MAMVGMVLGLGAFVVWYGGDKLLEDWGFAGMWKQAEEVEDARPEIKNVLEQYDQSYDKEEAKNEEKKVYLRGELVEITGDKLVVLTDFGLAEVVLPETLALRCDSQTLIAGKKTYLDYSRVSIDSQLRVVPEELMGKVKTGDELVVITENKNKQLVARMVVGFGCGV